jgi:hypothetical protein
MRNFVVLNCHHSKILHQLHGLYFAMDDSGSQTRLVWTDGRAHHHLSKKFRRN